MNEVRLTSAKTGPAPVTVRVDVTTAGPVGMATGVVFVNVLGVHTHGPGGTSVTAMVKGAAVGRMPSVATTVMLWLVASSKSSSAPLATDTMPVTASIWNLPPALSDRL